MYNKITELTGILFENKIEKEKNAKTSSTYRWNDRKEENKVAQQETG